MFSSQSVFCLPIFLLFSFTEQLHSILMKFSLAIIYFLNFIFDFIPKNHHHIQCHPYFPILHPGMIIDLHSVFNIMMYFELVLQRL